MVMATKLLCVSLQSRNRGIKVKCYHSWPHILFLIGLYVDGDYTLLAAVCLHLLGSMVTS